jgi:hypothetical protein
MGHSHKNTSSGGHDGHGDKGASYIKIGDNKAHVPPAGASNSYEQIRKKIDRHDDASLSKGHYTREKMSNK